MTILRRLSLLAVLGTLAACGGSIPLMGGSGGGGSAGKRDSGPGGSELYVMGKAGAEGRAVVALLPYTGGSAADFYRRYEDELRAMASDLGGLVVILPEGTGSAADYSTGGAWSRTIERYESALKADLAYAQQTHQASPRRAVVAGYSMGGDLAWAITQRKPELFAGAIVMGSMMSYRQKNSPAAMAKNGFRYVLFRGSSEIPRRADGMDNAEAMLRKAGVKLRAERASGEHVSMPASMLPDALQYILQ